MFLGDIAGEITFIDPGEKSFDLGTLTLGNHFDPTIRQIAHRPGHLVTAGKLPDRNAKADSLHPA